MYSNTSMQSIYIEGTSNFVWKIIGRRANRYLWEGSTERYVNSDVVHDISLEWTYFVGWCDCALITIAHISKFLVREF